MNFNPNFPLPNDYEQNNLQAILNGSGTDFYAYLFRLIAKGDGINRERLRKVYPNHVLLFEVVILKKNCKNDKSVFVCEKE